jgi:polysaccharide pyruvyl transferase WcaK-like protein
MPERHYKVVVETGSDFGVNKGDEAYFAAMVDFFKDRIPGIEIVKFDPRPDVIRARYGVRAVYSGGCPVRRLKSLWASIREIATADAYVWGGGQILLDEHGFISVPYRLSRPMLARLCRRPAMCYAVGVGPLTGRFCRWLARVCLERFSLVTVRDRVSVELLRASGVKRPILRSVDAAIALATPGRARSEEILRSEGVPLDRPIVAYLPWGPAYKRGKSLIPVIFRKGKAVRDDEGQKKYDRHVGILADALTRLSRETGAFVLIAPPDPVSAHGGDGQMARDIAQKMASPQDCRVLEGDYTPKEFKGMLGLMELAIGSRMHGLILAAGEGVPVVGICFSDKIRCFGEIIEQERYFVDESEVTSAEQLHGLIRSAWDERETLRREVTARTDELCDDVRANVSRLAALLEGRRP